MKVIMGMKEFNTPLKLVGLRMFKAYDGHLYIKLGKRPRKRLFIIEQSNMSRKIG
ncbi:hypothetical protein [Bacillus benzoevorans]|uniref:Uncharacterized protein n=1 Tax=Bacillus benzoevorans TaxID=1456 RepID=A0A7X0HNF8_9BACI|nr:hypothetical protein [Bacillus benzoevorans]MBB6443913.1 hypothetical protein [Bacillus benzoevorans]